MSQVGTRKGNRRWKKPRRPPPARQPRDRSGFEVAGLRIERQGKAVVWKATPSFDRPGLAKILKDKAALAARRSHEIVAELLEILESGSPLATVGQVAAWVTVGLPDVDDARQRFGLESQAEYLGGLALSLASQSTEPVDPYAV